MSNSFGIILTLAVVARIALQLTLLTRQRKLSDATNTNSEDQVQSYARQTEEKTRAMREAHDRHVLELAEKYHALEMAILGYHKQLFQSMDKVSSISAQTSTI